MFAPFYVAVRDFFARATHLGAPVPVVFARTDRAFEELNRVMKRRTAGARAQGGPPQPPATPQALSDRPSHVPFMSVWMPRPRFDPRWFSPARVRVSEDRQAGTATVMRWPRPVTSDIQVELWTSTDIEAQHILAQVELQFYAETAHLPVDWTDARWYRPPYSILEHAKVLGRTSIKLVGEGWTDNSDLEEGDGPKLTRNTWSGKMIGAIPYRPDEARLVRAVRFQIYDATQETPELLDDHTGGAED